MLELFEFLNDSKDQVRFMAAQSVAGLTGSKDHFSLFCTDDGAPIKQLMHLLSDDPKIAHEAVKALINLSAHDLFIPFMDDADFIYNIIFRLVLPKTIIADLLCMLLNNLSKHECIIKKILPNEHLQETSLANQQTSLLDNLIEVFARGEGKRYNPHANYHFLSGVLANLTTLTQGSEFMLGKSLVDGSDRLSKMIVFLGHPDDIRRGGVTSVIKNCCFNPSVHEWLLNEFNLLPFLLLPLAGPEDYDEEDLEGMPEELQLLESDKKREVDPIIRLILVETLILLATTRKGREFQRMKKVYPIIQKLHLQETDEDVQEAVERLVQLLMRDEECLDLGISEI